MTACTLCWNAHADDTACPPVPVEKADPRSFDARYPGPCTECRERIHVGDSIRIVDGRAVHADCVEGDA